MYGIVTWLAVPVDREDITKAMLAGKGKGKGGGKGGKTDAYSSYGALVKEMHY